MSIVNNLHPMNSSTGEGSSQIQFNEKTILNLNRLNKYGINDNDLQSNVELNLKNFGNITLATQTTNINIDNNVETSIFQDDIGDKTIPTNYLEVGQNLRITLFGNISTNESAETLIIKVKLGSTTIVTSPTSILPNSLINKLFKADINISCHSIGATGTVYCHGCIEIDTSSNDFYQIPLVTASAQTIDTTTFQKIDITAQFSLTTGNVLNVNFGQLRKI